MHNRYGRSNGGDNNAGERHNPDNPQNCLCEFCLLQRRRQHRHRQAISAHLPDQPSGPSHSERPSLPATPWVLENPTPSPTLPTVVAPLTRNPHKRSILSQIDTTAGSELYRAMRLGSQYGLPDIQKYAESGAQNQHVQPGPSEPAPICFTPRDRRELHQSPYPTQERDGRNRPLVPYPIRRSLDRRRCSYSLQPSDGEDATLHPRGVSPAPTGDLQHQLCSDCRDEHIQHQLCSDCRDEHAPPGPLRHVPAGPPPVLQQNMGLDGRSGSAELGHPTPTRLSPTTAPQTHRDNAVIKNGEEDDYSPTDSEDEDEGEEEDYFLIEREEE